MTNGERKDDARLEELKLAMAADYARAAGGLVDLEWEAQNAVERGHAPAPAKTIANSEPGNALSVIRRFL